MQIQIMPATHRVDRPAYAWLAFAAAPFTGLAAIPVGLMFLADPERWLWAWRQATQATAFGSYVIPGIYLLLVNGVGMLLLAALIVLRHWTAPWLSAILGNGIYPS